MMAWTVFINPMLIPADRILWLALPLCLAIAAIHRTLRAPVLTHLLWRIVILTVQMVLGLAALAAALWLILTYWPT